jgi:hypothetical protein
MVGPTPHAGLWSSRRVPSTVRSDAIVFEAGVNREEAHVGRDSGIWVFPTGAEADRLREDANRERNWKRWGPYLAERQWGTVREDYSPSGACWDYFPHDHARSRAYRWGEDGLLGMSDRQARLCFALALWNGKDPILKERLFGLSNPEGNHGEDVKECYFYLDATPTYSYAKALYRYPQAEFPYQRLIEENRRRGKEDPEFELEETGVFDGNRFFDVLAEYAKASCDDVLAMITVSNLGPEPAMLHVLPTLWFRNTWSWGRTGEGYWPKPCVRAAEGAIVAEHAGLGRFRLDLDPSPHQPALLFTENETNHARLFGVRNNGPFVKDAFHDQVIDGRREAVNPKEVGTKAAAHFRFEVPAGGDVVLRLRLCAEEEASTRPFGDGFDATIDQRRLEADAFYAIRLPPGLTEEERRVGRQAYAGLLWNKQFYHLSMKDWLEGDPTQPPAPESRRHARNAGWEHMYNRDVISMPDKWEYPWYASWDLGFHMVPFSRIDPEFAKEQLILLLREWYMHPNGQMPAYEFAFGDVNPPVHAWAAWRTYKISGPRGGRDVRFLARVFQKLLLNFTWWVNRKDPEGRNLFAGGFLGLDNIGVFDRSAELPTGGRLVQADATAWMAFYCATMLAIALELAVEDDTYEDMASKFFEHFVSIAEAMNRLGGTGLWDEEDGFYYDHLAVDGGSLPLKIRSMVGLVPLLAVELLPETAIAGLPGFRKRSQWFLDNRQDVDALSYMEPVPGGHGDRLLAIPSKDRLARTLRYVLDENEFLSPHGVRALSKAYGERPYTFSAGGETYRVAYDPGDSTTGMFGGNSNWRGPVWFPLNYLLVEALERYHHYFGDGFLVECPTGSGRWMTLRAVSQELARRLVSLFLPDTQGRRPCHGDDPRWTEDPRWRDLVLFHEYFHGDTGRGLGASHQTGWTSLVVRCMEDLAQARGELA